MNKVKLADVAIESRESLKTKDRTLPVVGLEHIIPEQINLTEWDIGVDNTFTKLFKKNDVLFGRRRAYLKKAAVAPCEGICSGDITVIRAKEDKILPELLPFVIQNDIFFDYAVGKSAGSLSPRVKWEHLAKYEFNLPSLPEQKKLAETLWSIVATMESYKKLLAKTDEMISAKFNEQFKHSDFKELGTICSLKARIGWQGLTTEEYLDSGDYLLITGVDFRDSRIDYENCHYVEKDRFEQDTNIQLKQDDILITKDGTIGKLAIVENLPKPATLNSGVFVLRNNDNSLRQKFIFYALQTSNFKRFIEAQKTGSTIAHLNQKAFVKYSLPVPTLEEQDKYIYFANKAEESKKQIQSSLDSLTQVYKKIIAENLGGK